MVLNKKVQAIIFRREGNSFEFLLLQKISKYGGFWQSVTGGVEKNDSSLVEAMKRELKEEIGVDTPLRVLENVYSFNYEVPERLKSKVSFEEFEEEVFGVEIDSDLKISYEGNGEHQDAIWCCFEGAYELLEFESSKIALERLNEILVNNP